ncbi:molecular chaperone HtpG [Candidatus Ichthyocystis hellenicum]|uniref:molecular chaperone HtpG n=1 Tax=Candidatus Ichthyocystis hellenicum TaxID=1561003 RepID=UPI000AC5995B|nr:molecular chaperone HtpG [Candidatus Ichthyocystis hellenicum]
MSDQPSCLGRKEFQAEVKQLLHLVINSLYSNKEIFLRELISNAADACDKLRYISIQEPSLLPADNRFVIRVDYNSDEKIITIEDNGIGMSFDEVVDHIGTIARSGTREFMSHMTGDKSRDSELIGQFGVGFYSAFVVAKEVFLETRRAGLPETEGVYWASDGTGEYEIKKITKKNHGTTVKLLLRDDETRWLNDWELKQLIKKYADHIAWPIELPVVEWDDKKKSMERKEGWEVVNRAETFWTRNKSSITPEEYKEFYQSMGGMGDFLSYTHNRVEGKVEYTQLLYIPKQAPFDLYDHNQVSGIKLYVQHVFIMDKASKLLPSYLRFVRGVIDASGLPLNVSREILQESRDVRSIRDGCTKKILSLLDDLSRNSQDDYKCFWEQFGPTFKEGIAEDISNRDRVAELLRFSSTYDETLLNNTSLGDYISRMKPDQKKIYYLVSDSYLSAKHSPHLEIFREKGIEVLLLHDRVDEYVVHFLPEFKEFQLQSIAKDDDDLGDMVKEDSSEEENNSLPILEKMKSLLADKVKDVRQSKRLTSSPSCLVADQHDMGGHMERFLKSMGQNITASKPILEVNLQHQLLKRLDIDDPLFGDWANVLFDQALLAEGGKLDDPATFVKTINQLMISTID